MKENTKRTLGIVGGITRITNFLVFGSLFANLIPGQKGRAIRNKMKLFRTGIAWKFTPFGDKEYQEKKTVILEKKADAYETVADINKGYINRISKEEQITLRQQKLAEIKELDKEEKQLKKTRK